MQGLVQALCQLTSHTQKIQDSSRSKPSKKVKGFIDGKMQKKFFTKYDH